MSDRQTSPAKSVFHRLTIEAKPGSEVNFGPGYEIASDTVGLIYYAGKLVAWTDDYGTARHPDHELEPGIQERVEALLESASDLWAVLIVSDSADQTPDDQSVCDQPPAGWTCSRPRGHDGPCAARPKETGDIQRVIPAAMGFGGQVVLRDWGWEAVLPDHEGQIVSLEASGPAGHQSIPLTPTGARSLARALTAEADRVEQDGNRS